MSREDVGAGFKPAPYFLAHFFLKTMSTEGFLGVTLLILFFKGDPPGRPYLGKKGSISSTIPGQELIKNTLASAGGNREASARMLGIGERTLYRKLDRYGLK